MHNWTRALDTQMDQLKWHHTEDGNYLTTGFFEEFLKVKGGGVYDGREIDCLLDATRFNTSVKETLHRGDTLYVTADMQHILMQAAHDLPLDVKFDQHGLISRIGFCMFEETMYGDDINGDGIAINAIAWHTAYVNHRYPSGDVEEDSNVAIVIYFYSPFDDLGDAFNRNIIPEMRRQGMPIPPLTLCHVFPARDGECIPNIEIDGEPPKGAGLILSMIRLFLAMQLLAQQKIGQPIRLDPDRAAKKRARRAFPDAPDRMITLITLRRKSVEKDDEEPQKVEWSRRWVVRGFWRRQWYPSLKKHDWKYIHEYIKGPEDKPLIITERRVFNFRR